MPQGGTADVACEPPRTQRAQRISPSADILEPAEICSTSQEMPQVWDLTALALLAVHFFRIRFEDACYTCFANTRPSMSLG